MASVQWTKHIKDEKDRKEFLQILANSTTVLNRLRNILIEEMSGIDNSEYSVDDFDSPSWSHKQAFRNGERARIKKLIDLLTIKREN